MWDAIVLGAGAAGLFCAAELGRRGRRVLLLEGGDRAGRKILISGGGRSNFTNRHCGPANFLSGNPHFAKSALARYPPAEFIRLVERHRIAYHEKTLGQLFCDGSAQAIVAMLEAECRDGGVELRLRSPVERVGNTGDGFAVHLTGQEAPVRGRAVIVATGGLSIPKLGATGLGYQIARSFGLPVVEPRAALVPLLFSHGDRERWGDLPGVAAEVVTSTLPQRSGRRQAGAPSFREKMLITHRGLSGPAILQVSSYWRPGERIVMDLLPGQAAFAPMLQESRRDAERASTLLRERLPQRLAERWLRTNLPPDWKTASLERLEAALHRWEVMPAGDEGYAKAEVTAGGVSTAALSSATMQATSVPGLAFIGEVVDVTGHLGGHNFQWAWSSAYAAAVSL